MQAAMKRNVRLMYAYRFLRPFLLIIPIAVPFFQENGLNQTQIFLLQALFSLTIVLLEVPSGYFADRVGRRPSMIAGATLFMLGIAAYASSASFAGFALAECLMGLGYSFASGADEAIVYDSLAELGKAEDEYLQFSGTSGALSGVGEALASVAGGLVALISLRAPFVAQIPIQAALVVLTLFIVEPPRTRLVSTSPFADVVRIGRYALHENTHVKWFIMYGAVVSTTTYTMVWLTQPYYQLVGVPLGWFGVLWAAQLGMMALFSHNAARYERWAGQKKALVSFPIIGVVTYVLIGAAPSLLVLPALFGFYFVRGVHIPILHNYVNQIVESDIRATVLSVKNLCQKLLAMLLGPLIGVVTDTYSIQTALLFSAGLYGMLSLAVVVMMRRHRLL